MSGNYSNPRRAAILAAVHESQKRREIERQSTRYRTLAQDIQIARVVRIAA